MKTIGVNDYNYDTHTSSVKSRYEQCLSQLQNHYNHISINKEKSIPVGESSLVIHLKKSYSPPLVYIPQYKTFESRNAALNGMKPFNGKDQLSAEKLGKYKANGCVPCTGCNGRGDDSYGRSKSASRNQPFCYLSYHRSNIQPYKVYAGKKIRTPVLNWKCREHHRNFSMKEMDNYCFPNTNNSVCRSVSNNKEQSQSDHKFYGKNQESIFPSLKRKVNAFSGNSVKNEKEKEKRIDKEHGIEVEKDKREKARSNAVQKKIYLSIKSKSHHQLAKKGFLHVQRKTKPSKVDRDEINDYYPIPNLNSNSNNDRPIHFKENYQPTNSHKTIAQYDKLLQKIKSIQITSHSQNESPNPKMEYTFHKNEGESKFSRLASIWLNKKSQGRNLTPHKLTPLTNAKLSRPQIEADSNS